MAGIKNKDPKITKIVLFKGKQVRLSGQGGK